MPDSAFVDREKEIAQLNMFRRQVHAKAGCILSIEGMSGIGKSELIKVFSNDQQNRQLTGLSQATRF